MVQNAARESLPLRSCQVDSQSGLLHLLAMKNGAWANIPKRGVQTGLRARSQYDVRLSRDDLAITGFPGGCAAGKGLSSLSRLKDQCISEVIQLAWHVDSIFRSGLRQAARSHPFCAATRTYAA